MTINERIASIKQYFGQFNIQGDLAFVTMKFPKMWLDTDYSEIAKKYNVIIEKRESMYFFVDIELDINLMFDAIDEVIKYNKQIELKATLFKEKMEELKKLFVEQPYEKLQTLTFMLDNKKKNKQNKKRGSVVEESISDANIKIQESVKEESATVETTVNNNEEVIMEETQAEKELPKRKSKKSQLVNFVEKEIC